MAGSIKLNAPAGGSVTLNAVDTAVNYVMQVPAAAGILINADSATGAAQLPVGTTGQRPASPVTGQLRFNSTTNLTEVYNGTAWVAVGGYSINFLIAAGGGGGGGVSGAGGGGAGGLLQSSTLLSVGTAYTITIGSGGAGATTNSAPGTNGTNTIIGGIFSTAIGGGGGGSNANGQGIAGGSGGGGSASGLAGAGTSSQGNAGGNGNTGPSGGGGGGAGAVGGAAAGGGTGNNGGIGIQSSISGSAVYYAGGGGGANGGVGGLGGGGAAGSPGVAGTANRGGGGGGGGNGGNGGSGIVIISYPGAQRGTGGTVTSSGGNTIHTFTTSGTYTA